MRPKHTGALALLSSICVIACAPSPQPEADLVVRGATVIDATGADPRPDTDIFIRDGVITAVVPTGSAELPPEAEVVDAAGAFAMPGLADMHVHFSLGVPAPRTPDATEEVLRRFLYYGVTTVLNLGGTDGSTDAIRGIWDRQSTGEVLGPTVYGSGGHLTLPGTHPVWTIFPDPVREAADAIVAETPEDEPANLYRLGMGFSMIRSEAAARAAVRERAEGGMQVIKIIVEAGPTEFGNDHPLMPVELIEAVVDEAERYGLPVLAHVTSPNELDRVLAAGVAGIAHAVADPPLPGTRLGEELAAAGFHVIPTLALYDAFIRYAEDPGRMADPFLRETVSEDDVALLTRMGMLTARDGVASLSPRRAATDAIMEDVGELGRRGVPIVLGSDVGNPMVFPGFSTHEELANLVAAGLTPMEAIRAASENGARMLGRENEFGTLQPGRRADVLVLDANPLEDIRNSRSIRAVILRGQVLDRAALLSGN